MTPTTCSCGDLAWQPGVLSVYSDGVQHWSFICVATDELLVDGGVA